jgi:hypothetical protein
MLLHSVHSAATSVPTQHAAGYLPLVWAGTLAYYFDNAFEEAGLILPVRPVACTHAACVISGEQLLFGSSCAPSAIGMPAFPAP